MIVRQFFLIKEQCKAYALERRPDVYILENKIKEWCSDGRDAGSVGNIGDLHRDAKGSKIDVCLKCSGPERGGIVTLMKSFLRPPSTTGALLQLALVLRLASQ